MKIKTIVIALVASLGTVGLTIAEEETVIALKDTPEQVQKAINSFISMLPEGAAKLDELIKETEGGSTIYEAEIEVSEGVEYEVEFNAQGKILEIDMEKDNEDGKEGD
jgi:hypothetical protein